MQIVQSVLTELENLAITKEALEVSVMIMLDLFQCCILVVLKFDP